MEQYGAGYNFEQVLKQNILNSDYFRNDCMKLQSWRWVSDQPGSSAVLVSATTACASTRTHGGIAWTRQLAGRP